ncbi:MAG: hypothetical protein V3T05_08240 [Myxococcota bacterium]
MASVFCVLVLAAGTYYPAAAGEPVNVKGRKGVDACHPLAPSATFTVAGPAKAKLRVWIDLPARPKKPRPLQLTVELDDARRAHRLRPRRGKRMEYEPAAEVKPSKPLKPIWIAIGDGSHTLVLTLPDGRSGCVAFDGLTLEAPPPPEPPVPEPVEPEPPDPGVVEPPPMEAPPKPDAPAPGEPAAPVEPVAEPAAADPSASLGPAASGPGEVHEIKASEIGVPVVSEEADDDDDGERIEGPTDLIRFGPKVGGVLPRGELEAGFSVGLLIDVPLSTVGLPSGLRFGGVGTDISLYVEGGWQPMRHQGDAIVPGRGLTQVIQKSLVLPFELGVRLRFDFGAGVLPYAAIGLAVDVTRTRIRAFSLPTERQNDVAVGGAAALGALLRAGPGGLFLEMRYREVRADLGDFEEFVEPVLAAGSLHLGYVVAISD